MAKLSRAGFTLLELTLVFAISGSLLATVLVGQRQLRSVTVFNGARELVIQSLDDTRNRAISGVVPVLGVSCGAGGITTYGGTIWKMTNVSGITKTTYVVNGANVCAIDTQTVTLPTDLTVLTTSSPSTGTEVVFVRNTVNGGYKSCVIVPTASVNSVFQQGNCTSVSPLATATLALQDTYGHLTTITINGVSGLAAQ